jgi:hypothetical protein
MKRRGVGRALLRCLTCTWMQTYDCEEGELNVCFESFCLLVNMDGRARALGLAGDRYERERERRGEKNCSLTLTTNLHAS